jgi:eukaryotic-like serine/threonine-protein kinase
MKLCPRCAEPYADDAGFCPLDGTALVRDPDPLLGRTLSARYRLVRRLGRGGMAVVYLARHVMIERLSAIKILRQDLGMNPSHRERFLREARAVNRINHPNIVEITDLGEDAGLVFLVMEYVEGESLLGALARGRFEWSRAARIALQIASALARAHELGVIHRDLKPENVLLFQREGADFVKLTDFGIAKIVDAPSITFSEQRFGTPGYIAPEYIEGAPTSPLGDLYALGIVLYEMLTGELPFAARTGADLIVAALGETPTRPSERVSGIPAKLEDLVLKMIARRPQDRPPDAFAVQDALAVALQGAPALPQKPPVPGVASDVAPAELAGLPTGEIAARWERSLWDLVRRIDDAGRSRGEADAGVRRARELAEVARGLVASLDRTKAAVSEHQEHVDRLEEQGREFRSTLGHAIDALSRDRSRERAHLAALAARRYGLDGSSPDGRSREARLWEIATLEAAGGRVRKVEEDLGFQVETLQAKLAAQNEQLDAELADATGKLEGALSALRRATGELAWTIEAISRAVSA